MTVRPEKSTRLPDRLPRKRPCLPFSRCTKPRMGLPGIWYMELRPGRSELMYMAHWICGRRVVAGRRGMVGGGGGGGGAMWLRGGCLSLKSGPWAPWA